jgi:hypothetical protein
MSLSGQETHGPVWRKASYSAGDGACVEVALADGRIVVRDSKNRGDRWVRYSARSWLAFISIIKDEGPGMSSQK